MRHLKLFTVGLMVAIMALASSIRITHASGNPFEPIWEAIHALQAQIAGLPTGQPAMYNKLVSTNVPSRSEYSSTTAAYAFCDAGDTMVSGGYAVNFLGYDIIENLPFGQNAWAVNIINQNDIPKVVTVVVRCADVTA